jgi:sulfoxide reductase heme-binding subunit YedZ
MPWLKNFALPATFLFLLLATAVVFGKDGLSEDSARLMIRVTAASSLFLFSLTFSASSLNQLLANGRWRPVMLARRQLGLSFALSHAVHLVAIVLLVEIAFAGDYSQLGDVIGGSVIYVFIFAMSLTSNNASVKLLGAKKWKALHKTGSYLIWVGLASSYVGSLMETGAWHYWLYVTLALGLIPLRIWAFWDKRKTA